MDGKTFTLDELCALTDYSKRTVRYYMQLGLVPRPIGEARAAYYTGDHLARLLQIKQLSAGGVSLERIREVITGELPPVPPRRCRPGSVSVRSCLYVAPGIEVQISPEDAGLTPEEIRALIKEILACANKLLNKKTERPEQGQ